MRADTPVSSPLIFPKNKISEIIIIILILSQTKFAYFNVASNFLFKVT